MLDLNYSLFDFPFNPINNELSPNFKYIFVDKNYMLYVWFSLKTILDFAIEIAIEINLQSPLIFALVDTSYILQCKGNIRNA